VQEIGRYASLRAAKAARYVPDAARYVPDS